MYQCRLFLYIDISAVTGRKEKNGTGNVIGRITADLEPKTSEKNNLYVRFDIAENIGSRQDLHAQYFQICAWGEDADRLIKAHAKKGCLIWVSGMLRA